MIDIQAIKKIADRVEIIGDAVLIQADCRDILPLVDKVDAVVTDPPYELSSDGAGKSHFGKSLKKFDTTEYKDIINGVDYSELFDYFQPILQPLNGFIFCSNKQISKLMTQCEVRCMSATLLVWHKTNSAPFANGVWRGDIEYIVHFRGEGAVFVGGATDKTKVLPHPRIVDEVHPTVKPLAIIKRLIRNCSNNSQTILDPFMGSGTTGVAALQMGRSFIGIEKEAKYFEIACKRIEEAERQSDMFIERPAKIKQEAML